MLASIHLLRTPEFWPGQRVAYVKAFTFRVVSELAPLADPVTHAIPTRDRAGAPTVGLRRCATGPQSASPFSGVLLPRAAPTPPAHQALR
jgi:hypothetical protein